MKDIKIYQVVCYGFRSIRDYTKITLDRPGLNLVKGINGTGKTTIFEAVVWCLYGVNLKGTNQDRIPTWKELRSDKWNGTKVAVDMFVNDDRVIVARGLGDKDIGDKLIITVNGDSLTKAAHKVDIQEALEQYLGLDAKTFMNSVMFGQRMAKLIESDNKDKRALFERLFETSFIGEALTKAKDERSRLENEMTVIDSHITATDREINHLEQRIEAEEERLKDFKVNKQARIDETQAKIDEIKEDLKSLQNKTYPSTIQYDANKLKTLRKKLDELQEQYEPLQEKINEYSTSAVTCKNEADNLRDDINNIWVRVDEENEVVDNRVADLKDELSKVHKNPMCPTCGQKLPEDNFTATISKLEKKIQAEESNRPNVDKLTKTVKQYEDEIDRLMEEHKHYTQKIDNIETESQQLQNQIHEIKSDIQILADNEQEYYNLEKERDKDQTLIESYQKRLEDLKDDLTKIKGIGPPKVKTDQMAKDLKREQKNLKSLQVKYTSTEEEYKVYDWWIKTGFSSKGLPAFIFKAMLTQLNHYIQTYADRLGVSVYFSIDLEKASKPFTSVCSIGDRVGKDYNEFSGGQKQRLDLVIMFAMHDLVSHNANVNLLIMDECFENLDEEGEAAVFELIRAKADQGKSIYIITHSPHIDSLYSSTIDVEEHDGVTKILK